MTGLNVELWLIVQMIIEVLLCGVMVCYLYRNKSSQGEITLDKEKMKGVVESLHRLIKESEDLDKKHQKVLELWKKIERKGAAIEGYIDRYEKKFTFSQKTRKDGEEFEGVESGVTSYEKASRLIEKGLSTREIAQKVGLPRGEVELIMNLKRQ